MAEATHNISTLFGLSRSIGRGPRLFVGQFTISDGDTIDTGLDSIEAAVSGGILEATAPTSILRIVEIRGISGGVITFNAREVNLTEAVDTARVLGPSTNTIAHLIVAGTVR